MAGRAFGLRNDTVFSIIMDKMPVKQVIFLFIGLFCLSAVHNYAFWR